MKGDDQLRSIIIDMFSIEDFVVYSWMKLKKNDLCHLFPNYGTVHLNCGYICTGFHEDWNPICSE